MKLIPALIYGISPLYSGHPAFVPMWYNIKDWFIEYVHYVCA